VQKVETLGFLSQDMTLAQAALRWVMATPEIASALPNIYDLEQLDEFTADVRDLTQEELDRVADLYERNFDVEPSGLTEKIGA
jgi:aryl-alcohol dehydrogenase-like predicted oxidoreductase